MIKIHIFLIVIGISAIPNATLMGQEGSDSLYIILSVRDSALVKFQKAEFSSSSEPEIWATLSILREKFIGRKESTSISDTVIVNPQPSESKTYDFYSLKKPVFRKKVDAIKTISILDISQDKGRKSDKYFLIEKLKEGFHVWEMYLMEIE